jgi:uncharacterized RDD family membrane protein YckC
MNNIAHPVSRFFAYLIDFLINLSLSLWPLLIISRADSLLVLMDNIVLVVFYYLLFLSLIWPFFNTFLISTFGGTIGKLLTGLKIVRPNNQKLSYWRAFFRHQIGYMISGCFLWLGFIWILIDKEKRAWHDQIADTYVVVVQKAMIILGLVVVVVMIFLNTLLIMQTVTNFMKHQNLYQTIGGDIASEIDKTVKEEVKPQD